MGSRQDPYFVILGKMGFDKSLENVKIQHACKDKEPLLQSKTNTVASSVQFSLFMHPDQAQNTSSGIQGQEATAVAVIYVTAPTSSRKTTKSK